MTIRKQQIQHSTTKALLFFSKMRVKKKKVDKLETVSALYLRISAISSTRNMSTKPSSFSCFQRMRSKGALRDRRVRAGVKKKEEKK